MNSQEMITAQRCGVIGDTGKPGGGIFDQRLIFEEVVLQQYPCKLQLVRLAAGLQEDVFQIFHFAVWMAFRQQPEKQGVPAFLFPGSLVGVQHIPFGALDQVLQEFPQGRKFQRRQVKVIAVAGVADQQGACFFRCTAPLLQEAGKKTKP